MLTNLITGNDSNHKSLQINKTRSTILKHTERLITDFDTINYQLNLQIHVIFSKLLFASFLLHRLFSFRKRTLTGIKVINTNLARKDLLAEVLYAGHPASVDQSGKGIADVIRQLLIGLGISDHLLARSFRGGCADGGMINVNLRLLWHTNGPVEPEQLNKTVTVWDGAHIIELMLSHTLGNFRSLAASKTLMASLSLFFR